MFLAKVMIKKLKIKNIDIYIHIYIAKFGYFLDIGVFKKKKKNGHFYIFLATYLNFSKKKI